MLNQLNIAVDVMGGDEGPRSYVSACLKFLSHRPEVQLTLYGDQERICTYLPAIIPSALTVRHTPISVSTSDKPATALRHKRDSSMAMAVHSLSEGKAHACVSSGNTGALMAFGLHYLRLRDGIERPAICKAMPSKGGCCYLLDIGANTQCSPQNLLQFAQLGATFAQQSGVLRPRVGLLNVGTEAQKGGHLQQNAAALLTESENVHFIGFVEGGDIYRGVADVVVCDGFSGNVVLKASEGAAEYMAASLKHAFSRNLITRLSGLLAYPLLRSWQSQFDPNRYNGAAFLGFDGIIVKSHGAAGELGLISALQVACDHAGSSGLMANSE